MSSGRGLPLHSEAPLLQVQMTQLRHALADPAGVAGGLQDALQDAAPGTMLEGVFAEQDRRDRAGIDVSQPD